MTLAATALVPAPRAAAQAPGGPCDLIFDNTPTSRLTSVKLPSGKYNSFIGGGVLAHCKNQPGVTLKSDSAEYYDEDGLLYLIGHVHYTDPRAVVDAHHMTYYVVPQRLLADTDVVATLPSGTTMHGPHADYLRSIPVVRPRAQLTAPGRPHFHLVQRDSATSTPDTAGVDANTVHMDGDSLVYASRAVVIKRTDLTATSDSAFLNEGTGFAQLMFNPIVQGTQQQHPFTLRGDVIDIYTVNHQLARVVSIQHADAVSKDMHLTADTIDLRFADKVLSRSYAWGPSRAHATTPERDILADSIDVIMPGQVVHEIRAIRKAYATAVPDTTHFKSKERDWMKGDTIIAYFDTTKVRPAATASAPTPGGGTRPTATAAARTRRTAANGAGRDTASAPTPAPAQADSQPEVRTLVANGDAHALYQLPPRDRSDTLPALNYVRGRLITIRFDHRQVQTVTVTDSASGVYLEPKSDSAARDSAKRARAAADTVPKSRRGKGAKGAKGKPAAAAPAKPATPGPSDTPSDTPSGTPPGAPAAGTPAPPPARTDSEPSPGAGRGAGAP